MWWLSKELPRNGAMLDDIKARFHDEMLAVYRRAKDECHDNATRFLQMVREVGGVQAAKALLHAEGYSEGLTALWELGRLDISMEAVVIQQPWSSFSRTRSWSQLGEGCKNLAISRPKEG